MGWGVCMLNLCFILLFSFVVCCFLRDSVNTPMWYAEPPTRSLGGDPIGNGIPGGESLPNWGGRDSGGESRGMGFFWRRVGRYIISPPYKKGLGGGGGFIISSWEKKRINKNRKFYSFHSRGVKIYTKNLKRSRKSCKKCLKIHLGLLK